MKVIKRSIVFVALFVCLAKLGWSQTMLSVADLKNQTGETVNIADSVYSGQIFQKSVMVLSLGNFNRGFCLCPPMSDGADQIVTKSLLLRQPRGS